MTIPDAVQYNFDPLMMSTNVLETCRGIKQTYYETIFCALSWLIAKIILRCTVSKMSKTSDIVAVMQKSIKIEREFFAATKLLQHYRPKSEFQAKRPVLQ